MSPNEQAARRLAEAFREEHRLGTGHLGDLFELVHAVLGLDVVALEAGESEHGLSMRDPNSGRVVIAVATTAQPMRQRSSLAHEVGHVLAGDLDDGPGVVDDADLSSAEAGRTRQEIRADAFARHLLLPEGGMRERVSSHADAGDLNEVVLSDLVQTFEASPSLAAIQLKAAKLIDAATAERWMRLTTASVAARHGWLGQYKALAAASSQPRAPQSLMHRAVEGYRRGVLGAVELAAWYGQSVAEVVDELGPPDLEEPGGDHEVDDVPSEDRPLFPPGFLPGPAGSS